MNESTPPNGSKDDAAASVPYRKERLDLIARVPPLREQELAELWRVYEHAADEAWLIVRLLDDRDPHGSPVSPAAARSRTAATAAHSRRV